MIGQIQEVLSPQNISEEIPTPVARKKKSDYEFRTEISEIAEAVAAGIEVFVLCYHGAERSATFAEILQDYGIPIAHISGGTQAVYIESILSSRKKKLFENLLQAPYLIFLADEAELDVRQRRLMKEIEAAFAAQNKRFLRLTNMDTGKFIQIYEKEKNKV